MSKKYYYVYVITNLINGKQYIGDHSTNEINDHYLGSGNLIKKAISKYGKENFRKEILELCETKQEAFEKQEKYINEYETLSPNGYNISPKGGHNVSGCISEETKRKIGKANKGKTAWNKGKHGCYSKEALAKMSKPKSDQHKIMIGKSKVGNKNFLGKNHTQETKEKISKSNKGKKRSNEVKKQMSKRNAGEGNPMYNKSVYAVWEEKYGKDEADKRRDQYIIKMSNSLKGLKRSKESKENIKRAALNRSKKQCPYCLRYFDPGNYKQFHGEKCKMNK